MEQLCFVTYEALMILIQGWQRRRSLKGFHSAVRAIQGASALRIRKQARGICSARHQRVVQFLCDFQATRF